MTSAEQLVLELIVPEQRENALLDLSKVELLLSLSVSVSHSLQRFRVEVLLTLRNFFSLFRKFESMITVLFLLGIKRLCIGVLTFAPLSF
jgi:hypothetical protein